MNVEYPCRHISYYYIVISIHFLNRIREKIEKEVHVLSLDEVVLIQPSNMAQFGSPASPFMNPPSPFAQPSALAPQFGGQPNPFGAPNMFGVHPNAFGGQPGVFGNPFGGIPGQVPIWGNQAFVGIQATNPCPPTEYTYDLGDGYVAEGGSGFSYIHLKNGLIPANARAFMNSRTGEWEIKDENDKVIAVAPQRCPRVWGGNLVFLASPGSQDVYVVLGLWDKDHTSPTGEKTRIIGWTLAGGGHYESSGVRRAPRTTNSYSSAPAIKFEDGDIDWWNSANKELTEEVGVIPENIRATLPIAVYDDPLKEDPRFPGVELIYARWVQQAQSSKELKKIALVPLSQIAMLLNPNYPGTINANGVAHKIVLGHDRLLRHMLNLPQTQKFIQQIKQMCGIQTPPLQIPPLQRVVDQYASMQPGMQAGVAPYGMVQTGPAVHVL